LQLEARVNDEPNCVIGLDPALDSRDSSAFETSGHGEHPLEEPSDRSRTDCEQEEHSSDEEHELTQLYVRDKAQDERGDSGHGAQREEGQPCGAATPVKGEAGIAAPEQADGCVARVLDGSDFSVAAWLASHWPVREQPEIE
jgi:hypothetical protein